MRGNLLVVFAGPDDPAASALAAAWPGEIAVVSARDLSSPGWHLAVGHPGESRLTVAGRRIAADELAGVVTRVGWIGPGELSWIAEEERDYVAAEMHAFMLAFLDQLPCPVLNRPTAGCLAGPVHRPAVWRAAALRAGLQLATPDEPPVHRLSIVGDSCFGTPDRGVARSALALAHRAGAPLLALEMAGDAKTPRFVGAHPFIDIGDPLLARAVSAAVARPS